MPSEPAAENAGKKSGDQFVRSSKGREERISQAVGEYLAASETGPVNRSALLAKYADVATELLECLETLDFVNNITAEPTKPLVRSDEANLSALAPRADLGDFRILREIGRGGMGVVYEAEQMSIGRRVALKVLPFAAMLDKQQLKRFKNEARAAGTLDHPNIVAVHSVGVERGVHYYAMQLVEGQSLAQIIAQQRQSQGRRLSIDPNETSIYKPLENQPSAAVETQPQSALSTIPASGTQEYFLTVAQLGAQAAEALDHAHQTGIIHRDVKPGNLMLDTDGKLWVTDFGLARNEADPGMTITGALLGTLAYMSPEQALAKRVTVDHRTDIYSLGVTIYELLTLQPPFVGDDRGELLRKIAFDTPRRLRQVDRDVPEDLETIVSKAIERSAHDRYATAQEMANDLRAFVDGTPIKAKPLQFHERAARWAAAHRQVVTWVALALILMTVGLAVSSAMIAHERDAAEASADSERELRHTAQHLKEQAEHQTKKLRGLLYAARMRLAGQAAGQSGGLAAVGENTAKTHPSVLGDDLRGWEWYFLNSILRHGELTLKGHGDHVRAVSWSPNGKEIASASDDHTIRIWSAATGSHLRTLRGHAGSVQDLCWSPDGRRLGSASADQTLKTWDAESGNEILTLRGHVGLVHALCWSPDGNQLASAGQDQTIRIWNAENGTETSVLRGHSGEVYSVAWSPQGGQLASGSADKTIRIWDRQAERTTTTLRGHTGASGVRSVSWSSDALRLASADHAGHAKIWDVASSEELASVTTCALNAISWSPDDKYICAVGRDDTVKVWDASSEEASIFRAHTGETTSVCWSPDGKQIASASLDHTVKVWNAAASPTPEYLEFSDRVYSVSWKPDGSEIASSSADGVITTLDIQSGTEKTLRGHDELVYSVEYSHDGRFLASGGADHSVRLWECSTSKEVAKFVGHIDDVLCLSWSPTADLLATASLDRSVIVWETAGAFQRLAIRSPDAGFEAVAWNPRGNRLATARADGLVQVWDAMSGANVFELRGHRSRVRVVDWSPDGKRLASGSADRTVKVWDAATGKMLQTLRGHTSHVRALCWSPDGRRIVAGSSDAIKIWDPLTGEELLTLADPYHRPGVVRAVCFDGDGKRLAQASGRTVAILDATMGHELEDVAGN